jgi:hypothetical protein
MGYWILGYFMLGLFALIMLDLMTYRIRRRVLAASVDAQTKLAASGSYVSPKMAMILLLGAIWVFWPAVIYAAIRHRGGNEDEGNTG